MKLNEDIFEIDIPEVDPTPELTIDDIEQETVATPAENGVATLLINSISDTWNKINDYNSIISTISSSDIENAEEIISVVKDVVDEEHENVGKLMAALTSISPNTENVELGQEEADMKLTEDVVSDKKALAKELVSAGTRAEYFTALEQLKYIDKSLYKQYKNAVKNGQSLASIASDISDKIMNESLKEALHPVDAEDMRWYMYQAVKNIVDKFSPEVTKSDIKAAMDFALDYVNFVGLDESLKEATAILPDGTTYTKPIKYNGYKIKFDPKDETFSVYDKYGELEDYGFTSIDKAKHYIDWEIDSPLNSNDNLTLKEDFENSKANILSDVLGRSISTSDENYIYDEWRAFYNNPESFRDSVVVDMVIKGLDTRPVNESKRKMKIKESLTEAKKPKYWNTLFTTKVIDAYNNKDLTLDNIEEWETKYNNGIKPNPSLGTKEILTYYLKTKKDPRNESLKEELRDATEDEYFDMIHDVYNALADVAFKYSKKGIEFTSNQWDDAYEWWGDRFFTADFDESLKVEDYDPLTDFDAVNSIGKLNPGDKFKNRNGVIITIVEPTKDGRVQYRIRDEVRIGSERSIQNMLYVNNYLRINESLKEDIENLEDVDIITNPVMQDAKNQSERASKGIEKEMKDIEKDIPEWDSEEVIGAKKQEVPKKPEEPKATLDESLFKEAKFGGYNYQYEVHWMAPTGRDILLGGSKTREGAEDIAKDQIQELIANPWSSVSEKIRTIDSLYIYDSVNEDEDVMSNDLANFIDHAIFRLKKKIEK